MTVMIGGHSALGNIRVDRILYTYPNGVYLAQISAFDSETNQYIAKTNNNGECSGTLIPQSSIGGKIPSTRGFYNEKSKTFFQPGVQS